MISPLRYRSFSASLPVVAAISTSFAAKSQCGQVRLSGRIFPTKHAASSNVSSSPPGPPFGSITRVSFRLKLCFFDFRTFRSYANEI
jgi:hypothetical protein